MNDINPFEAVETLRAFRGLQKRLNNATSMEQVAHIEELAFAFAGKSKSRNGASMESIDFYRTEVDTKINNVITSLEGLFDWLKGNKGSKSESAKAAEQKQEELEQILETIDKRDLSFAPVSIDGLDGGALVGVRRKATDPEELYKMLDHDYGVLKASFAEFKKLYVPWKKWAVKMTEAVENVVDADRENPDLEKIRKNLSEANRGRVKAPTEVMSINPKLQLQACKQMVNKEWDKDQEKQLSGSIKIDPIKSQDLVKKLAKKAEEYLKLSEEVSDFVYEGPGADMLPGGDDYPYRDDDIVDVILEVVGERNFDWEGHSEGQVLSVAESIAKASYHKFRAITKWLDRGTKEE